ncbi:hypothetical protein HOI71_27800 [Candidatus Poribacteria bacterium]|jgi:enterochelin esterase-like enzyme|nr:hypothetical protein [Candidatus Poribacteria bacterium]MBT7804308.1 hypothetical protein [Candidatus Poribacteria bacterium]
MLGSRAEIGSSARTERIPGEGETTTHRYSLLLIAMSVFAAALVLTRAARAQRTEVEWDGPPETWHWNIPDEIPGFIHSTIHSQAMVRTVGYNIWLPPSYAVEAARHYPVVYYLHGASGSERSALEFGDIVRDAVAAGRIGDVIYVFPNGGHFSRYRDWKAANVKAETLIIEELIPRIDETYRTIADREGRALCGWSMGGGGAIRFALKYPEMFCAAASMAAAIGWQSEDGGDLTASDYAEKNAEAVRTRTKLMLVCGEDDGLFSRHELFLGLLDALVIPYTFEAYDGVGHDLGSLKTLAGAKIAEMLARSYAEAR